MKLVKTKSFELAVNKVGDKNSSRLALLLPGRLDTKDYPNFISHQKFLADKGFFTVCFDPPGTWESPGPISLFTTTNYIKAVNELIEYYGNRPTLLLGHSRGGNTAILASTNSNVIALILVISSYKTPTPPTHLIDGVEVSYRDIPVNGEISDKQKEFRLPVAYFEDGEKYNPMPILKNCLKPKLIFSGTNDKFYTPKEVGEIFRQIPEPKILHELKSDHNYYYHSEVIEEVDKVTGEFIEKYLK